MTEEEAKTKWCPFVRAVADEAGAEADHIGANRWAADPGLPWGNTGLCIGSACMAWRAKHPAHENLYKTAEGWCGLAGVP